MGINIWAVLVADIVSMVVGGIWYGPLFGKQYGTEMGFDSFSPEKKEALRKKMIPSYFYQFIVSLVMFYVLAWYIVTSIHTEVFGGIANAFGVWIGFMVPVQLGSTFWGGSMKLFWINTVSMLITLLIGGAIIGAWR